MYKMILFDVDGVFLSEERCFDASALSVWELLYAPQFLALAPKRFEQTPVEEKIRKIRQEVFQADQVLDWMKTRGINSNWDMVFLTFGGQLLLFLRALAEKDASFVQSFLTNSINEQAIRRLGQRLQDLDIKVEPDFSAFSALFADNKEIQKHEMLVYFNQLAEKWFGYSVQSFSRNSEFWLLGQSVFQEWYMGASLFAEVEKQQPRNSQKRGFLENEIPLAQPELIAQLLIQLKEAGVTLGIGTGRPFVETKVPLETLGLYHLFDEQCIVTASDVIDAEEANPQHAPLGKPEPFTYIKGYLGREANAQECLELVLPLPDGKDILIVGDSVADYLAARKMGCDFAATLTGLTGLEARGKFEELKADHIFDNVLGIKSLLKGKISL